MSLEAYFGEGDAELRKMAKAPTDIALNKKLEQLVRETAQNSADEALDGEQPRLVYRYEEVTEGDGLDDFLEAIDWPTLKPHLEAAAEDDDEIGIASMVSRIEDEGELPLLFVEDYHTSGLHGEEDSDDTNYVSLVKDFGSSTKEGAEGGVHGVGASVLWGFSGLKTALFLSDPAEWEDDRSPRLVGRVDLPDHDLRGTRHSGAGWIGADHPGLTRPGSMYSDEATTFAEDHLGISRDDTPGTTAAIVGFREPTVETREPSALVDRLEYLVAKFYWPLIVEDRLTVSVQGPGDDEPREVDPREASPNGDSTPLKPYIEAYEARLDNDDSLEEPGDVAVTDISLDIPVSEDAVDDIDDALEGASFGISVSGAEIREGETTLAVRSSEGDYGRLTNRVAMFRGAGHVVKYRKYNHTARATGEEFHGVLTAGKARHPPDTEDSTIPDEDHLVEDFFRTAEPEAHDTWEKGISQLQQKYPEGSDVIDSLLSNDVHAEAKRLLAQIDDDENDELDIGDDFPYFPGGPRTGSSSQNGGGGGSQTFDHITVESSWFEDEQYHYRGELELNDPPSEDWKVSFGIGRENAIGREFDTLDVSDADVSPANDLSGETATVPAGTTRISFEVESGSVTAAEGPNSPGRTKLKFEVTTE